MAVRTVMWKRSCFGIHPARPSSKKIREQTRSIYLGNTEKTPLCKLSNGINWQSSDLLPLCTLCLQRGRHKYPPSLKSLKSPELNLVVLPLLSVSFQGSQSTSINKSNSFMTLLCSKFEHIWTRKKSMKLKIYITGGLSLGSQAQRLPSTDKHCRLYSQNAITCQARKLDIQIKHQRGSSPNALKS